MKQTEHCELNQWELSDPIRMADFNADNAKIAAELAELRRAITGISFYLGELGVVDMLGRQKQIHAHTIFTECFIRPDERFKTTGGVTFSNNRAILTGKGATGTITGTYYFFEMPPKGNYLHFWSNHKNGRVTPTVNGKPLSPVTSFRDMGPLGEYCTCSEFLLKAPLGSGYDIVLNLDCGNADSMEVHDFYMAFL
nr:hypothetical protein [uncultured Oscillibacter sp.]